MIYSLSFHFHITERSGKANTEPFVAPIGLLEIKNGRFTDRKEEISPRLHLQQPLLKQIYGMCKRKSNYHTSKEPIMVVGSIFFNGIFFVFFSFLQNIEGSKGLCRWLSTE